MSKSRRPARRRPTGILLVAWGCLFVCVAIGPRFASADPADGAERGLHASPDWLPVDDSAAPLSDAALAEIRGRYEELPTSGVRRRVILWDEAESAPPPLLAPADPRNSVRTNGSNLPGPLLH
jgi:hypothetical protein